MSSKLETLSLLSKEGTKLALEPKFKKNTLDYTCLLPSSIDQIQIDCFTLDENSSYKLLLDGVAQAETREFINFLPNDKKKIKIQVESSDGSEKSDYVINVTRLSKSTALMADFSLQTDMGTGKKPTKNFKKNSLILKPEFSSDITEYNCQLEDFKLEKIFIRSKLPDSEGKINYQDAESFNLEAAITNLNVTVTSPDGTNSKNYKIVINRSGPAVFIEAKNDKVKCYLSKSLAFPPIIIGKNVYNQAFFETLTRFDRSDPFSDISGTGKQPLEKSWHTPSTEALKNLNENINFSEIIEQIDQKFQPEHENEVEKLTEEIRTTDWYKKLLDEKFIMPKEIEEIIKSSKIETMVEKYARSAFPDDNIEVLLKELEEKPANFDYDRLINCCCKNKNFAELGKAIELKNYEKWLGEDKDHGKGQGSKESRQDAGMKIKMSGWEDDIKCVCELHGLPKTSTLQQQLQALDKELQSLKEQNADHSKMDHVRELYAYKQKQAVDRAERTGEAQEADKIAYGAYFLGLKNNNGYEKFENLFLAGRGMFKMGKKEVSRYLLRSALSKNPKNKDARFYLALIDKNSNDSCTSSWPASTIKIHEKYLLYPTFKNKISKSDFTQTYGIFTFNINLYRTDLWLIYNDNDPKLLYILWNFIKSLKTTSNAYQKTAWKILEISKTNKKIFSDEYLKILTKSFKFSDSGRISKFLLEIEGETLKKEPRNVDILINYGNYCYEIASDEDEKNVVEDWCRQAEVCFRSAIEYEKQNVCTGPKPDLKILKTEEKIAKEAIARKPAPVTKEAVAKKSPTKPPAKLPLKVANKPAAKGKAASKSAAKPAEKATDSTSKSGSTGQGPVKLNPERPISRLYLAKTYKLLFDHNDNNKNLKSQTINLYKDCLAILPDNLEANIDLARLLVQDEPQLAVDYYEKATEVSGSKLQDSDKSFIASEIVNILLKLKKLDDPRLEKNMIIWAKTYGLGMLDKATKMLEDANKTFILRKVYCEVHGKSEEDAELKQFFNFKCW